jgi:hypothetical protein
MLLLPFIIPAPTNFFCFATHSGPLLHTMSYAVACGIPALTVVTVYKVEGNAGDRFGAKWVLVAGLLVQNFGALGHFFANNFASFFPWRRCLASSTQE